MSHGAIQKIKVAPFYLGHGVYRGITSKQTNKIPT